MVGRMVNMQHVNLNDPTQVPQLGVAIGKKNGLIQQGHDLIDCHILALQQRKG